MFVITLRDIISLIALGIAIIIAIIYYTTCKIKEYKKQKRRQNNGN